MDKEKKETKQPKLVKAGTTSLEEVLKIVRSVQKEIESKDYNLQPDPNVRVL